MISAAVERLRSRRLACLLAAALFFPACDPPGKPKLEPDSQDVADFSTLFADNCAGCHGSEGRNGPGRILNDPLYLAILPRDTLKDILVHGRPGTAMPAWAGSNGGPLTDRQIDILTDGMKQRWGKPFDSHGVSLPAYAANDTDGNADAGRKLFLRNCFMCHGPGAKVGSVTEPAYLSLVSNQMLRTSIIVGRPDLGMPDYRTLKLGKPLTGDDVSDLVAFLVSKRPPPATAPLSATIGGGEKGPLTRGNEGSGNGPGSPRKEKAEGNKSTGSSSQRGIK
jgi:cytochrome c oxidase cbb3-type subunit III